MSKKREKTWRCSYFGHFGMGMWVCAFFIQFVCRMFYWNKSRVWVDWRTHSHMQHIICVYYQFILVVNLVCECEYCQNDIFCSYFAVFSVVSQPPPPPPPPLFKLCRHIENNNNRYSCNQTVINHPHKKYAVRPFFTFDFNIWLQKCRHTHNVYTAVVHVYRSIDRTSHSMRPKTNGKRKYKFKWNWKCAFSSSSSSAFVCSALHVYRMIKMQDKWPKCTTHVWRSCINFCWNKNFWRQNVLLLCSLLKIML